MSELFVLTPEVAGQLGPNTILVSPNPDKNLMYPKIENLEYIFYGWMGDELITSHPIFIVTESLGKALVKFKLTGFKFANFSYHKEVQFEELYPDVLLPKFVQLQIFGNLSVKEKYYSDWSGDDVSQSARGDLVVSKKAYEVIREFKIQYCEVEVVLPFKQL